MSTLRKKFEDICAKAGIDIEKDETAYVYSSTQYRWYGFEEGWRACEAEQSKRIAELQAQNAELVEALTEMETVCVLHIGADYTDHIHHVYKKVKRLLEKVKGE